MRYQKHLTSEQLIALCDDDLNFFSRFLAKRHLARCGECRQQASELEGTIRLASHLASPNEEKIQKSKDCLDDETIADYVAHQLSQEDKVAVENHLASCHYCLHEVSQLHSTVRRWYTGKLSKAPRQMLQGLKEPVSKTEKPRKFRLIPVGVGISVCLLIALVMLSILYVSQDRTIQTASDIQGAFTYLAQSEGIADALQPFIHEVELSHPMDNITRGIIESESMTDLTRYFLAGVCIAESYLSISKMDESEVLRQHSSSLLLCLETLLNEPDTAALSKAASELRARAESGLYSGSDLTPLVLELNSSVGEIAKREGAESNFLFGQWLVVLSTQAEIANMTPNDELLRRELDKLLRSETIKFFKSHLKTASNEEQQWLGSVLSNIEEFSTNVGLLTALNSMDSDVRSSAAEVLGKIKDQRAVWSKLSTEARNAISIYLSRRY